MQQIRDALVAALVKEGVSADWVHLEPTADLLHGDYASGVALANAKQLGVNPRALAEKLVASLGSIEGVSKVEIAGPGFINFTLDAKYLTEMLEIGRTHGEKWGSGSALKGQKVMVEYTDPNPFKEFHIGHLMSNAIGESIARLIEFAGAEVKRANWQGDVGPHVAKALWGKMQKPELSWGAAYAYGAQEYEKHKEEIDAINKKVYEKSDEGITRLYDEGRAESLAHFEEIYTILGTKFDYYFFEGTEGLAGVPIVEAGKEKGIFEESDGAVVFRGEKYGLHTRVFLTSKGLPTYEAKELGLNSAKFAKEPSLDQSIIITANEQSDYFRVVLKAMEMVMPEIAHKTKHVPHGMMRFAEGKMSSRTGNVITGESLVNDLIDVAKVRSAESRAEDKDALAKSVAVAAIKFQILKGGAGKDIVFNREQALSVEGDSGPYLQYTHARCHAIVEKADEAGVKGVFDPAQPASDLARLIFRFYETVLRAQEELEPHHVANYLVAVASAFNSWYAKEHILDGTPAAAHKVALTDITRLTLKNGLWLLGIPTPERV
jgi:arginyl-tRNA synthetase